MLCATTPQNIRQTKFFTNVSDTEKHPSPPSELSLRMPAWVYMHWGGIKGGEEASNDGGFTTTLYQTVPNTEQTEPEVKTDQPLHFFQTSLAIKPSVLVMWGNRSTRSPCIVQLPLSSPPVFGTNEFGKVRAWNPKCVDAFNDLFFYVCVHVCVCLFVIKIMAVRFCMSRSHSKNLYTFSICPNLNQNNTVFRVGRGHLKSFVKCRWPLSFWW